MHFFQTFALIMFTLKDVPCNICLLRYFLQNFVKVTATSVLESILIKLQTPTLLFIYSFALFKVGTILEVTNKNQPTS